MNEHEISQIFKNNDLMSVNKNLGDLFDSYKLTNNIDQKKSLKQFLKFILMDLKNKNVEEAYKFIKILYTNIHRLCTVFQEILNEEIKLHISELETDVFKNFETFIEDTNKIQIVVNFSVLIVLLTNNLNQPNQILTNYILILNSLIDRLSMINDEEILQKNILLKFHFILVLNSLSENTYSYNPSLINHYENIFHFLKTKFIQKNFTPKNYSDNHEVKSILYLINSTINNKNPQKISNFLDEKLITFLYTKITTNLSKYINAFHNDLNIEIILKNIILCIISINENLINKKISTQDPIIKIGHVIIDTYEEIKIKNYNKKCIEINFLKLKKKEIQSLDPEIESSFLGRSFIRTEAENQKVSRAIQKKIKSTKRQAIRNLKKEALVIDVQRQKKVKLIDDKRKEDQKLSNQFIEQQNVEYKKMVTSQGKKRFKLKGVRGAVRQKKQV
jgi:hypothetical protein